MTELEGFVAKPEQENINISSAHPLREAALLVAGVTGMATLLFFCLALIIDFTAPLIPPRYEYRLFSGWLGAHQAAADSEEAAMETRARQVLADLLEHWDQAPFPIRISIHPSPVVNAFALPGGAIRVTTGLMENIESDEELAFVIGHELGHFAHRDHLRGLGRSTAMLLFSMSLSASGIAGPVQNLIENIDMAASRSMDRQQELDADAFGVKLLVAADYDLAGPTDFLTRCRSLENVNQQWLIFLATHPAIEDRLDAVRKRIINAVSSTEGRQDIE